MTWFLGPSRNCFFLAVEEGCGTHLAGGAEDKRLFTFFALGLLSFLRPISSTAWAGVAFFEVFAINTALIQFACPPSFSSLK